MKRKTATADETSRLIPLDRIRPSKDNPRKSFDGEALQGLADSIKSQGVLQPILLRPTPSPARYSAMVTFEALTFGNKVVPVRPGRRCLVSRAGGVATGVPIRILLHRGRLSAAEKWRKKLSRWGYQVTVYAIEKPSS